MENLCNICKRRAYIACELCDDSNFFCSRGHLHSHKLKTHKGKSSTNTSFNFTPIQTTTNKKFEENEPQIDTRKLFEHLQRTKNEIDINIKSKNYVEAILGLNKSLAMSKKFYEEDHIVVWLI
jgi:hypothetical protein